MSPIFDSHLHIIDPRFPLVANQGYLPGFFTSLDYHAHTADLKQSVGLEARGGAVVAGSFQAFDQTYLEAALAELAPGFVGVTQLPFDTTDAEIIRLDQLGVRAVRFNLFRGGAPDLRQLDAFARRVHAIAGWHSEFYVNAADLWDPTRADFSESGRMIGALPAISIDHLGLTPEGLPALLELAGRGARVKATGFGRLESVPAFDLAKTMQAIVREYPADLMFGSDLPGTRAPRKFRSDDITLIRAALSEFNDADRLIHGVLYQNAVDFYRIA